MARVSNQTIVEVWQRQEGMCAMCGDSLKVSPWENHHMLRVADGGSDSADNIVLLCDRDEHLYVHAGDFTQPVQTTPENYPYFHGRSGENAPEQNNQGDTDSTDSPGAEEEPIHAEQEPSENIDSAESLDADIAYQITDPIDETEQVDKETEIQTLEVNDQAESAEAETEFEGTEESTTAEQTDEETAYIEAEETHQVESVEAEAEYDTTEEVNEGEYVEIEAEDITAEEVDQAESTECRTRK
jgi:hypothetical protein